MRSLLGSSTPSSTHEDQRNKGSNGGDGEKGGINAVADRASVRVVGKAELDSTPEHGAHIEDHPAWREQGQSWLGEVWGKSSAHQKRANKRPLVDSVAYARVMLPCAVQSIPAQMPTACANEQGSARDPKGRPWAANQLTKSTRCHYEPRVLVNVVREECSDVQGIASGADTEGEPSSEPVAEGAREERGCGKG